MDDSDWNPTLF